MPDTVLAQHLARGAGSLAQLAPHRLLEIERAFSGPGPLGDFDAVAEWCSENPVEAMDLLVAIRDALGDAMLGAG
jgi:hypothetical protein